MSAIKDKACNIYKGMTLREKLLTLVFILVILILWTNNWTSRLSKWNTQREMVSVKLTTQQQWLDQSDYYAAGLAAALERVDPDKTKTASELSGRIDSLVREAGLTADIDPVRTREGEIFNDHNLRLRLSRITIAQFIKLNNLIKSEKPYINLQDVRIKKNSRPPHNLEVRYEINSFDLIDPNL